MAADKFGGVEKEKRKEGENVHLKTHAPQGVWVKIKTWYLEWSRGQMV